MKMHQVRYFLALCREKNFTQAARRCGVRQPSITVAIKQLENEFGGRLFERDNSRVRLSALGELVRGDLARIDRAAAAAKRKAASFLAVGQPANTQGAANQSGPIVAAGPLCLFDAGEPV